MYTCTVRMNSVHVQLHVQLYMCVHQGQLQ